MERARLLEILGRFPSITIAVVGDFFLDKYLVIDPTLSEASLETGLEAQQVVAARQSPGAAGTVTSNLRSLGAQVMALGFIGDDGGGLELERGLRATGVETGHLVRSSALMTPTYIKPVKRTSDGAERELNRLDIKNRRLVLPEIQTEVISRLRAVLPQIDGLVVVDQVEEPGCGVITERVREALVDLAGEHPSKIIAAESRARIGLFRRVILKPNLNEALRVIGWEAQKAQDERECIKELYRRAEAPVFMTRGAEGIMLCDDSGISQIPAVEVKGPVDIVGAGDSVLAGVAASLCAGATHVEAAMIGNLAASVTVKQIGTTGTATPGQILDAFEEYSPRLQSLSRSAQSSSVQSSNEVSARPAP